MSASRNWVTVALLIVAAGPAYAQGCMSDASSRGSRSRHNSTRIDDDRNILSVRWRRGDCEIRVDARGDFGVRPDLSGFTGMDEDGYVDIEEIDGNTERRVRVTRDGRELRYRWTLDGRDGFDVNRERWLADMLLALERGSGMFAKARVPALLQQGGPGAVLDETGKMESDYVRKIYFLRMQETATLDDAQTERMLRQTDTFSSDYERGEVLRMVARRPMSDRVTQASIAVAGRMSSDYEKRRALAAGLNSATSPQARTALFAVASTMSSGYELAELLIAAQGRSLVDSVSADAYFRAVGRVQSDYERRRTLSALLKQRPESPRILAGILRASTAISSDHELANLLVEFTRTVPVRGEMRELFLSATRSIGSDYEYRRTLQALLEQDRS